MTTTFKSYLLTYYDPHHTLDGGTMTLQLSNEKQAQDFLAALKNTMCHQHSEPQRSILCIRNIQLIERTTTHEDRRVF